MKHRPAVAEAPVLKRVMEAVLRAPTERQLCRWQILMTSWLHGWSLDDACAVLNLCRGL